MGKLWTWVLSVGCVGLLYLLSTEPLVWLQSKGRLLSGSAARVIEYVYRPVDWAY